MKDVSSHFPPQHPNTTLPIPDTTTTTPQQNQDQNPRAAADRQQNSTACEWDFTLSAVVSSSSAADTSSDAIGVVEFDPSNSLLASGGIARKIRIYNAHTLLAGDATPAAFLDHAAACEYYICTPAKLSSLRWKPGSGSRLIGSGDYDGVVMEYDLETRAPVFERDEHGGRRVWSMDYSHSQPTLGASASDDGTMQMWDTRSHAPTLASVQPDRSSRSPVCCVEFSPFGGSFLAVGSADRKIYGYDVRRIGDPVLTLIGHEKAVTYVKFLDSRTIVSSSVDGCLIMWGVEDQRPIRTYRGHVNSRRFVGLSVWRDGGLLSCGSENNRVFVYDKRWADPIWVRGFDLAAPPCRDGGFVSSVCWRQGGEGRCTLVAGGSDGVLQVFAGQRNLYLQD